MFHPRTGLAGSALAVIMLAAPGLAQDDPGARITSLYQAYAEARTTLSQSIEGGSDAQGAFDAAADARAELEAACQSAGAPDLATCLDTYVAADVRVANDTQPLPEPPAVEAPVAEEPPAEEPPAEEQPTEEQPTEEQQAEEQQAEEQQAEEESAPQQAEEEPAAEEPTQAEEAPAEEEPAEEQQAQDQQSDEQTADEQPASEEPAQDQPAETETETETDAEAAPTGDDVQPESVGTEVQAAYAAYADARARLETARAEDGDVVTAAQEVNTAFDGVVAACEQVGTPDLATCLDTYVSADVRLDNDLEPVTVPEPTAEEGEQPAEDGSPEEQSTEDEAAEDEAAEEDAAADQDGEQSEEQTSEDEQTEDQEPVDEALEEVPEEDRAPVLDSEKEQAEGEAAAEGEQTAEDPAEDEQQADADQQEQQPSEPPQSDEEAQTTARTEPEEDATEEQGEEVSVEQVEQQRANRRHGPENAEIVEQDEFRVVFQFNNQLMVQNQDRERLGYQAEDRNYQNLRNGRLREEIVRQDGTRVITIYNRNGDILHRRLIEPDGSEYVLAYTPPEYEDDVLEWRDPARDLPPLRLNIPADDYVLDAQSADQQRIEDFLARPPVEQVRRYYAVEEVKRSARLRDVMRRLEVGDLTFATGSAALSQEQFGSLSLVAEAMLDMIDRNPAETFLIEGHTDAVGSAASNLALSDRRAETVAVVLTQTFGVPPQNLATQGYGERYLRVRTEEAERLNRRVTVKRITPLVSPAVASNGAAG